MNELYEKNVELIKEHMPLLEENKDKLASLDISMITCFQTQDNQTGMYMQLQEGIWQFNSEYAAEEYANIWWEQFGKISYNAPIFIFGLGNGQYLRTAIKNTGETNAIVVYEPCPEIFMAAMSNIDFAELVEDRVGFVVEGINDEMFDLYVKTVLSYANHSVSQFFVYPGYNRLFSDAYSEYCTRVKKLVGNLAVNRNTEIRFSNTNTENLIQNLKLLPKAGNIKQLFESLPSGVPAIIVAAGPSLNKNIHELKKAKNKAFIIATDTALKPLLHAGIVPDIFVTVDAEKPLVLFEDDRIWDIPMCAVPTSNYRLMEKARNRIILGDSGEAFFEAVLKMLEIQSGVLETGGSVANNAYSLAEQAGMNPIILVGQDLAFTGDKSHADGTFKDKIEKQTEYNGKNYVEVEDIHGNKVMTLANLRAYKEWFEMKIRLNKETRVIDATEGGAKIIGTEILDLKTTIERECTKEIDFEAIIKETPPYIEGEKKEKLIEYLLSLPAQMKKVKRKAVDGQKQYKLLMKQFEKQEFQTKEFKKVTKKITRLNEFLDEDTAVALILPYISMVEYMVKSNIYEIKEDMKEEGKEIGENGLLLLRSIVAAIDELLPKVEGAIKEIE